jgi:hypothetical protein
MQRVEFDAMPRSDGAAVKELVRTSGKECLHGTMKERHWNFGEGSRSGMEE